MQPLSGIPCQSLRFDCHGMEGTDLREPTASTPPPSPLRKRRHLTDDHDASRRKIEIKETGRFIPVQSRVILSIHTQIYQCAAIVYVIKSEI